MDTPYGGSPLSPANPVSTELKSDPIKTSELLKDIANALQSPLPTPADYVRRLEADLAVQATPTPSRWHAAAAAAAAATPSTAAVGQSAKELVASLEALLQQPAATPGRAAMTALRRSTTTELTSGPTAAGGSSSAATPNLAAALSFGRTAGRSEAASGTAAAAAAAIAAAGDSPAATPTLPRAPPNRWRLAAERAASFRSPPAASPLSSGAGPSGLGGSSGRARSGLQQVSFAPGRSPASPQVQSPADSLLAEIARAVTPASPAAAAPPAASPAPVSPAAMPSFSSGLGDAAAPAAAAAGSPSTSSFTYPAPQLAARQQPVDGGMGSPLAGRWQAVAASRPAAASSSHPASLVVSFGFAGPSPAPLAALAVSGGEEGIEKVTLHPVQLDLRPPGVPDHTFEAEAGRVLEELSRFEELERSTAAEFSAGLAAQLERMFVPPPAVPAAAVARCC